jgi:hypothetical protein
MARVDVVIGGEHVFTEAVSEAGAWQQFGADPPERASPEGTDTLRRGAIGNLYGLHEFPDIGYQLRLLEPLLIEGTSYYSVEVTAPDGHTEVRYIDPETHLVTRKRDVRAIHPDIDPTQLRTENTYLDFRTVDGILRPFRFLNRDLENGELLQETEIKSVELNPAIDRAIFAFPTPPTPAS